MAQRNCFLLPACARAGPTLPSSPSAVLAVAGPVGWVTAQGDWVWGEEGICTAKGLEEEVTLGLLLGCTGGVPPPGWGTPGL